MITAQERLLFEKLGRKLSSFGIDRWRLDEQDQDCFLTSLEEVNIRLGKCYGPGGGYTEYALVVCDKRGSVVAKHKDRYDFFPLYEMVSKLFEKRESKRRSLERRKFESKEQRKEKQRFSKSVSVLQKMTSD